MQDFGTECEQTCLKPGCSVFSMLVPSKQSNAIYIDVIYDFKADTGIVNFHFAFRTDFETGTNCKTRQNAHFNFGLF